MSDSPRAPFTMFGQTLLLPVVTYTAQRRDHLPKPKWHDTLWIERGEDWYALGSLEWRGKTIRVVHRADWLSARESAARISWPRDAEGREVEE